MNTTNNNGSGPKFPEEPSGPNASQSRGWDQPRTDEQGQQWNIPGAGTDGYSRVNSPYGQWNEQAGQSNPETGEIPLTAPVPQDPTQPAGAPMPPVDSEPKKKRTVGIGTALAMMLVVAIGAGGVTGVLANRVGDSSVSNVNDNLRQPVSNSGSEEKQAPKGSIEDVASKALPAVVSIQAVSQTGAAEGSGSIISADGYVLTNHHVVAGGEDGIIEVTLNDGTKHRASFVASDANTDIAVIKIEGAKGLPYLEFGDSDALAVGQEVVAVGSPLGLNATVTSGIVSALNRPVRAAQDGGESSLIDAVQTDAAVNPGNSGGPLVDMNGQLVGMNSMIASLSANPLGGKESGGSIGLGFAIPSNFARRVADQLINDGQAKYPLLGVQVDGRNSSGGAKIVDVEDGSPADKAGLQPGDTVVRVNDRAIEDSDSLIAAIRSQDFGAVVSLEVTRGEEEKSREVEVNLTDG